LNSGHWSARFPTAQRGVYLDRESHYVWGKRYLLKFVEEDAAPEVKLNHSKMLLRVRPRTTDEAKHAIIAQWYRGQIKAAVPDLIAKWEPKMGVKRGTLFRAANEDEVGKLQPRQPQHPAQHRVGQETTGMS